MSLCARFSTIFSAICTQSAFTQFGREVQMTEAPTRPLALRSLAVSLVPTPTAPAEARRRVRAAIESWDVAVDPYVAALLTSELVTNAIMHTAGSVRLIVTCSRDHLRVYVHDTSRARPVPLDPRAEAEDGRGLVLVDSLSTDWGSYRTADGKAVYFTLAFGPGLGGG
jgi:anti-sigma regulatory factor (Ser/Thr protein kinase)